MKLKYLYILLLTITPSCYGQKNNPEKNIVSKISELGPVSFNDSTLSTLSVTGPCTLSNVQVLDNATILGPLDAQQCTFKKLSITGSSSLNTATINEITKIIGSLKAKMCTFSHLHVTGSVALKSTTCSNVNVTGSIDADDLTVSGATTIVGIASFNKSKLEDVTITTERVMLNDTTTHNIHIKENKNPGTTWFGFKIKPKQQVLELRGSTEIIGNLTFDAGNGKVVIKGKNAKINGVVTGAIVTYE